MTAILTAAEMRALERAAIESGEVTGLELMERAGRGVVEAILAEWPEIEAGAKRAVVLCGPGNNGGDGFVVARLLRERGWAVEAFLYGNAERLPPDARANHDRWAATAPVRPLDPDGEKFLPLDAEPHPPGSIIVDALFGIGLTRPLDGLGDVAWWTLMCSPQAPDARFDPRAWPAARVVAIDVPSGLDADSGRFLLPIEVPRGYETFRAHLTVTFHRLKPGHFLAEGPQACGVVRLVDLDLKRNAVRPDLSKLIAEEAESDRRATAGLPEHSPEDFAAIVRDVRLTLPDSIANIDVLDAPVEGLSKANGRPTHKFNHGHALILSGGAGRGGAARLSARGTLRAGAGLVTLAVPPAALQENAARLDAVMLRSVRDPGALTDLLADPRLNALCVGPGFGTGERQGAMLAALLDAAGGAGAPDSQPAKPRSTVLDADALTLLARDPALRAKLHDRCVLTPHEGEFARLFPGIDAKWRAPATTGPAFSKVDAAREAAREAGCVVLLKGPDTVIAEPSGRAAISAAVYDRAAPWLATAGSGDVLAGFITGLLARGFAPFDAACTAAWLHVECARSFGPGLIAEDLPEELPKVFRALGL